MVFEPSHHLPRVGPGACEYYQGDERGDRLLKRGRTKVYQSSCRGLVEDVR